RQRSLIRTSSTVGMPPYTDNVAKDIPGHQTYQGCPPANGGHCQIVNLYDGGGLRLRARARGAELKPLLEGEGESVRVRVGPRSAQYEIGRASWRERE